MRLQDPLATITPTVDGDVLTRLARIDTALSLPQLSRLIPGRSYHGVRNAVARLVEQGIVSELGSGRTRLYQLNRNHLAAEAIISIADSARVLGQRILDLVSVWRIAPSFVALFGSAARGEMRDESDIDLLLTRASDGDESTWSIQLDGLIHSIELWTGNDAEIVDYLDNEIAEQAATLPLLAEIERDATFIVGTRHEFRRLMGLPWSRVTEAK
ncbi:nucleotidyltransferase family protein [Tessaracoccus caeni]|uniref:nucleotidyltransferase family protein n=1 Tax=Tessaracoccus caeni TaxID=3031239 RepID=UPI0023DCCF33|nr:nucleotidyltransferase domain-containing protein [Tessaracoccus caeni]MDF1487041.1 nucleotidyltransferase domain-containing protein [Tessaracoccus caeni]